MSKMWASIKNLSKQENRHTPGCHMATMDSLLTGSSHKKIYKMRVEWKNERVK